MAPESTRSSSSTASRRLRGLLRRTLGVVRPISDTLAALGAAGQARRIAWTRSTVAPRTTPPLICRGARRHRCLPTYALAELPRKLAVLRRECERIGRDPATLRVTEEAVLALARRARGRTRRAPPRSAASADPAGASRRAATAARRRRWWRASG